jgi:hypothetical protein
VERRYNVNTKINSVPSVLGNRTNMLILGYYFPKICKYLSIDEVNLSGEELYTV